MELDAEPINTDVLDRIPLTARSVLEVGCGNGALGAEYKRRNPICDYFGIETDTRLAARARQRIDAVFAADMDTDPTPFGARGFDAVVYNDGLEHLRDPWGVLKRHAALLSPGGTLVLCVPNMEHWSFALRLLRGEWDYTADGLTDIRHLRWFGKKGAERAIAEAGLTVQTCVNRVFDARGAQEFVQAMLPALPGLRIAPEDLLARAAPLQYIYVATKGPVQPLLLYSSMLAPVGGVSHVRVIEPMEALGTVPGVDAQIVQGIPASDVTGPRIFIFHRPAFLNTEGLEPVREAMRLGYLVVCEFDDHPDGIPVLQLGEVQNFRAVHAVQTSTETLAATLRAENPEVAVFANGIRRMPEVRNYQGGPVTLFFAGLNRTDDWPPYIDALNAVVALVGERLAFRIVGDRGLFEALATPHKTFTPICDYETYQALLGQSEISFMPLRETPFNHCKSDLKFIEAAAHRVTPLASPVAYDASIVDGQTGVLFRDPDELRQRLLRLVVNPEVGQAIGDAARRYVAAERMLAYGIAQRLAWYHDLWARKAELDRALALRVPALFETVAPVARFGFDATRL
jgi:SAM-dependent methyltransferase/glycosyltransferase involved in cell wall biosynthesis